MKILTYKDLIVWQKSMKLVDLIYTLTKSFPSTEQFNLTSQMRRCSVSIASNIAEGKSRGSKKDYRNFLLYAFSSANELETQLLIAKRHIHIDSDQWDLIESLLNEVQRMLNKLIHSLTTLKPNHLTT